MRDELVKDPLTDKVYLGQSICTVYRKSPYNTCGIWNFGHCKSTGNFYFNKRVHLPQDVLSMFEGVPYNEDVINEMESLGIYNGDDTSFLLRYYEKAMQKEEEQQARREQMKNEDTSTSKTIQKILTHISRGGC